VACTQVVWVGETWTQERLEGKIAALREEYSVGDGSKGLQVYDWDCIRLPSVSPGDWAQNVLAGATGWPTSSAACTRTV